MFADTCMYTKSLIFSHPLIISIISVLISEKEKEKKDDVKKDDKKDNVEVPQAKQTEEPSVKTAGEKTTSEVRVQVPKNSKSYT